MIGAAIRKDAQLLLRDRGALASLFVLPVIFIAAFGSMFGGGGEHARRALPLYVGKSPLAEPAGHAIEAAGLFEVDRETSPERVRQRVVTKQVACGLVLPDDFDPVHGHPAELVIDEAGSPQLNGPLTGALQGLLARGLLGRELPPVLVARTPPGLAEPLRGISGFQISVPGNAVLFGFFLALTVGISFVTERRTGTFRRLMAAPVHRPILLLAKLVPFFLIGLVQMALLFGIGAIGFHMRVGGSVVALVVLTVAVVFTATSLGLVIASFSGTERQVGGIGSICLLVMGLLGGGMVPRLAMPAAMQRIGLLTPHAWALDGYYDVLVRQGATLMDIAPQILAVFGFGIGFAVIGLVRFRFEA